MTDKDKSELFLGKNLQINQYAVNRNQAIYKELIEKYPDLTFKEICWQLHFGMNGTPVCPVCGKPCKFEGHRSHLNVTNNGYFWHCSKKCSINDDRTLQQIKDTKFKLYGDENYNNFKQIKQTYTLRHGGMGFASQSATIKQRETAKRKYGKETYNNIEQGKATKLQRYGSENYCNHEQYVQTCLKRYGVVNYWCTNDSRAKRQSIDVIIREMETKKRNGSFKRSKYEDIVVSYIKSIYKGNIKLNDRETLHGIEIDILIPDINLGIEIEGDFFHANPKIYKETDYVNLPGKPHTLVADIWKRDEKKVLCAKENSINLLRYWTSDIDNDFDRIQAELYDLIHTAL